MKVPVRVNWENLALFLTKHRFQFTILMVLVGVLIVFIVLAPGTFLTPKIYSVFMQTAPFGGLMALGLMYVVTMGGIDLSYPSVMGVSALAFAIVTLVSGNPWLGFVCALAMGAFAGVINGILVAKVGMPAFVATVAALFFWKGVAKLLADATPGAMTKILGLQGTFFSDLFVHKIGGFLPAQFVWFVLISALLWLVYTRHTFGNNMRFIGGNEPSARMVGIKVDRVKITTFIIAGMLAALSGIMLDLYLGAWFPTQGEGLFLPVFAIVFIGGTSPLGGIGTVFGTFIGTLVITVLETGIVSSGFSGYWTDAVMGFVIAVAITVQMVVLKRGKG